jgi:type IV pilus assembly protein PilY1
MHFSTNDKKNSALKRIVLWAGVSLLVLMAGTAPAVASCNMNIADVPLDSLEQAAPGMIMFVIDDSGSMDWSVMCPPGQETNGVFNGYEYIFSNRDIYGNSGDDAYTSDPYDDNLEDSTTARMMWMSQWSGYNGMYYDPTSEYTPWPTLEDADIDQPRFNPMNSSPKFDMTAIWDQLAIDNRETTRFETTGTWSYGSTTTDPQYGQDYLYASGGTVHFRSATWTDDRLDRDVYYNVEARWSGGGTSRSENVTYRIYNGSADPMSPDVNLLEETQVSQAANKGVWNQIGTNVKFPSGTGVVQIYEETGDSGLCADAVRFVPADGSVNDIMRRHYFVVNAKGTFLINLRNNAFEYYKVVDATLDKREIVTVGMLKRLTDTEASSAGIVTGRTYTEECQNFANWYSFYRRRELTAKNAIANMINSMDGVYVGMISINGNMTAQRTLPVRVNLDGTFYDESSTLLTKLYTLYSSGGTPLRNGLKNAGEYFDGDYLRPSSFASTDPYDSNSYPYFKTSLGGTCQQAFTILFSDGYYNGSSPYIGNEDNGGNNDTDFDGSHFGDGHYNTLADVAMLYFEKDLNTNLNDNVAITTVDPAPHQHMVTYTIAFGVTGTLDTDFYGDCPIGTCPSWPDPDDGNSQKIDDLFHAAVNGRGEYLAANNTTELNEALETLKNDIAHRLGSAAALATNSVNLTVGSVVYQGTYNTANWYGDVSAMPLSLSTGAVGTPLWVASDHIPAWNSRNILSMSGSGIVFDAANLSDTQKGLLTSSGLGTAEEIVNFIRGDKSKSVDQGGTLRNRSHPIGDVVHSEPTYYKGVVYIGANDGMLHALDAATGEELFAYVPNLVYENLSNLADPGYDHQYFVDNTAVVGKVGSKHLLVGGLGKGGKGYFGLDVTDALSVTTGNIATRAGAMVLWELTDSDLGYTFSKAVIVNTKAAGNVVIFGNGYESTNGKAVLYVLQLNDDLTINTVHKLDTGVADCNGLATPAVVDVQLDGVVDFAYAGDLKGNMWKFDLRGDSVDDWGVYYQDGSTPKPLVTVKNTAGTAQPITARPEVMLDCVVMQEGRGLMVIFGTGKFLSEVDFSDNSTQAFYGIWDWGNIWELDSGIDVAKTKFFGEVATDRSLSELPDGVSLLSQSEAADSSEWGLITDYSTNWYDPFDDIGTHVGWVMDLEDSGERSLREPMLRDGVAFFVSTIPSISACTAGGSSYVYQISACSGGKIDSPLFDVNGDGKIDTDDKLTFDGSPEPPSKLKIDKILFDPIEISDQLYLPDDQGDINELDVVGNPQGMFYWRVLGL